MTAKPDAKPPTPVIEKSVAAARDDAHLSAFARGEKIAAKAGNGVPPKPMGFDNDEALDAGRDPGGLIVAALADVALIFSQIHTSYMRSDVTPHRERFNRRVAKLKEITNAKPSPSA